MARDRTDASRDTWRVRLFSFEGRDITDIVELHYVPHDKGPGLSLSPDDHWVLGTEVEVSSDLMLVENFR